MNYRLIIISSGGYVGASDSIETMEEVKSKFPTILQTQESYVVSEETYQNISLVLRILGGGTASIEGCLAFIQANAL